MKLFWNFDGGMGSRVWGLQIHTRQAYYLVGVTRAIDPEIQQAQP